MGAKVTLSPNDTSLAEKSYSTGENGEFRFSDIVPGDYRILVSFIAFESLDTVVVISSADEIKTLKISLSRSPLVLNPVSVTASRRREKLLDAPASVSIIGSDEIESHTALASSEYAKGEPGVDMASTGLSQSNVVMRGFNNVFSGALLFMVDNRIARVPSLRYNAYNFIPTISDDIERIELVSGPGSALYGPNSASGIMHIITKSPLSYKKTIMSIGGGERDVFMTSFLRSDNYKSRIGYRISGQYYRGIDWKSYDRYYEPDSIRLYRPTPNGPVYEDGYRKNTRDFNIEKLSSETRVDYLVNPDLMFMANAGINRSSELEITSLGAAQAKNWTYYYGQLRMNWKNLFAQVYLNGSDAGGTYLLRTGQRIIDKSKFWSAQVQHHYNPTDKLSFTYGFDSFFTRPNTEYTLNGRNENKDSINEYGIYLQTEIRPTQKIKLIEAARLDSHSRLDGLIFSPRSAISYEPNPENNLRLTFNRAYSTPYNTNFFLDILQAEDPFGVGRALEPYVGFDPSIDVRVQGVPESGFHWSVNSNGPQFSSSFASLDPRGLGENDFIDFNDPIFTNVMWNAGRDLVISEFANILNAFGTPPATVDSITNSLDIVTPTTVSDVGNSLMIFNPNTSAFEPFDLANLKDIDPLKPEYTNTLEFGYKGVLAERARIGVDIYYTHRQNFITPLQIETPNVFLDQGSLADYLETQFGIELADSANQEYAQVLSILDDPSLGGNGNGSPVDELANIFSFGAGQIPFGTVSPVEAYDPQDVLVTFRNFGSVSLYGIDLSFEYALNNMINLGANYSYISKNIFRKSPGLSDDILLNSPRNKAAVYMQYSIWKTGLGGRTQVRYVDAFDMYGPFIGSRVKSYIIVDQDLRWFLSKNTSVTLTIQNLFDNRHIEFVGAPKLGRLAILRGSYSF